MTAKSAKCHGSTKILATILFQSPANILDLVWLTAHVQIVVSNVAATMIAKEKSRPAAVEVHAFRMTVRVSIITLNAWRRNVLVRSAPTISKIKSR
jgi:hypothetical protein